MIKEVKIQNYKSVQDLTLELGRVNVLIGANGCGKSNILEAIAMGSAAADNKLSNEFLSSRGIRVTDPKAMRSGFERVQGDKPIYTSFNINDYCIDLKFENDNKPFSAWKIFISVDNEDKNKKGKKREEFDNELESFNNSKKTEEYFLHGLNAFNHIVDSISATKTEYANRNELTKFLIYAPENTFLRKFEDEGKIEPLGIRGEGLFKLLSEMSSETPEEFQELIENLELMDWFEGFEIPKDLVFTERRIRIKDRFLEDGLKYFDQRNSNEGFLYLMFYFALFISKYTPKFFAIDNIDASLNPKLCSELIKILTKLAKKHDKQVIFTTHNPAILDGLNLNDDEQRLMVVYRNVHGHTKTKRITKKETPEGSEPVRLSEQFLRGYLGGLPNNF
jgi:predicted ATPase